LQKTIGKYWRDYPGSEQREVAGLTSKADADEWINGNRKVAWLRSQGFAK